MHKTKIEISGIKYNFGIGFLNLLIQGEQKNLNELSILDDVLLMPLVIYYSRVYACERDNLPITFSKKDILNYIDDNGGIHGDFYQQIYIAYANAMTKDVPADEDKKKVAKVEK